MYNLDNKADLDLKMRAFYNHVSTIKSTIEEFNETGKNTVDKRYNCSVR